MTVEGGRASVPATLEEWVQALRKSADIIMEAPGDQRPSKSGAIAGALNAAAGGRVYDHNGVLHAPDSGPNILVTTAEKRAADRIAVRLRALELPGIASIEVTPYGDDGRAEVRLTPHPRPTPPGPENEPE